MLGINSRPVLKQYLIGLAANMAYFQLGMGFASLPPSLSKLSAAEHTVLPAPLTQHESAAIVAAGFLAGCLSLYIMSWLCGVLGRRAALVCSCAPRLVATLLLWGAQRVWGLALARVLIGLADGVIAITPVYVAEIASKQVRGSVCALAPLLAALGSALMLGSSTLTYRALHALHAAATLATTLPLLLLPESPYYLYTKGHHEKSIEILKTIRTSEAAVEEEIHEYGYREKEVGWRQMVADKISRKTLMMCMILALGSQATGYNAVFSNLQCVLERSGVSVVRAERGAAAAGALQLLACALSVVAVERVGRKPLIIASLLGMATGLAGIGVFIKLKSHYEITGVVSYLPLASMSLLVFCDNFGVGTLVWVVCAELGAGAGGVSAAVCGAGLTSALAATALAALTARPHLYAAFAVAALLTALYVALLIPETRGKSYMQIQRELGRQHTEQYHTKL